MKIFTPFLFFLFALAAPLFAQTPLEKVSAACKIFPTYEAGVNNGAIAPMEYSVFQMKPGSEEMLEAEKMLLAAFPTATLDGQRTIGRILYPIAGPATVETLTPFLTSDANQGETAKIAAMLIDFVKKDHDSKVPKDTTFTAPYRHGEFYRNDFTAETDAQFAARLESETAAVLACSDPEKRLELLEKMGTSIERTPAPLEWYKKLLASPDVVTQKQVWDLMGRYCRKVECMRFAAEEMKRETETAANAALAAIRIANVKRFSMRDEVKEVLTDIEQNCKKEDVRQRALAVLRQIDVRQGGVFMWLATQAQETPDENPATFPAERWSPLVAGQTALGWELATTRHFPKGSFLYLRNVVESEVGAKLNAELTSPAPVRFWLNGKVIFESKTGSEKPFLIPVTLNIGRNPVYIEFQSQGRACPFSLRFLEDGGAVAQGLKFTL